MVEYIIETEVFDNESRRIAFLMIRKSVDTCVGIGHHLIIDNTWMRIVDIIHDLDSEKTILRLDRTVTTKIEFDHFIRNMLLKGWKVLKQENGSGNGNGNGNGNGGNGGNGGRHL